MIKAPYNFVPLSEKVFYPPWADQVSHDVPFSDGESGEIDITITAKSPIFIRNHEVDTSNSNLYYTNDKGKNISTEFCHYKKNINGVIEKEYYIPSTSLKGMTRNILEIISFSKIPMDEKKFKKISGVRDMTAKQYCEDESIHRISDCPRDQRKNRFEHDIVAFGNKCGLVNLLTGEFIDYGEVIKVKNNHINRAFNDSGYNYTEKSIFNKYQAIAPLSSIAVKYDNSIRNQKYYKYLNSGENALLFMNEHFGSGYKEKKHEFLLLEEKRSSNSRILDTKIIQNFKDVYFKYTYTKKENNKWDVGEYWENQYDMNDNVLIPVFYVEDNNSIKALGLTQVFKLPYKKIFLNAVHSKDDNTLDLAETIFGTVNEETNFALKGRVQFSHFKSTTVNYSNSTPKEEVLAEPKPTYYPNYIMQTEVNDDGSVILYKTLMDTDAKISGWKRYPLRRGDMKSYPLPTRDDGSVNHDVATKFIPLDNHPKFNGKIRFHNLKKAEIGALLSALTFHGNEETNHHNIGMAKSLGYGQVKININSVKTIQNSDIDSMVTTRGTEDYLKSFESYMMAFCDSSWIESEQIKELLAMSNHSINNDENLKYQSLDNEDGDNDFVKAKESRDYLHSYSYYLDGEVQTIQRYASDEEIKNAKEYLDDTNSWLRVQEDMTIDKLKEFIRLYPENRYKVKAQNELDRLEDKEKQNRAKDEHQKILNLDERFKNQLPSKIEKFKTDFSEFVDMIRELEQLLTTQGSREEDTNNHSDSISIELIDGITDKDEMIELLRKIDNKEIDDNLEIVKQAVERTYNGLDSKKKKKNFMKALDKSVYKNFSTKLGLN